MAAAFQALLRGDTAERDRQVERARKIMDAQAAVPNMDMDRAGIVAGLLRLAEREIGRPLTVAERTAIERDPAGLMRHLVRIGYKMPTAK